ncbi:MULTISPECIES: TIGR03085 family metal-binding protein [Brevibacterium]|uniref:TIGR03085 family protein n=2 Tax=Brevibacterium antiquum TaxID=234835 RepID=A0A2H1IXT0_9MICO|nr:MULTISPECIES: TIGR03085 family metal-binding protein [Brevibacterium]SMX75999.1 TIGR03085 family protein [Brevibacterium antiquum]SMX79974.1 TIGR03085 family protein [Brevibacterium antiquum CNRZ 918]HCG56444.1 TIGR03085 family protein [Brevibacterium sp.]
MNNLARTERLRLVDAARRAGEDAPTLCEGWTTRDLATHLVIRERHLAAALGIFMPKFEGKLEAQEQAYASMPYPRLLGLVASPPRWTPGGWPGVESVMNTAEYLVHHEDIRRAAIEWIPRRLSLPENRAVWTACRTALLPFAAKAEGRVEIVGPGFGQRSAGRHASGSSGRTSGITITGEPVEILLYLMGREEHALVDVR